MKKTKKLLSLLTALAMTASAFTALTVPASAAEVYKLDLTGATTGDVTKKAADNASDDELATFCVDDLGTGTDKTPAAAILDGWGYQHYGYSGGVTSGRQSNAGINAEGNYVYIQGVGNAGSNGALSFIPANKDGLTLSESGVQVYELDATVLTTGGGRQGNIAYGFTSGTGGKVADAGSILMATTGVNNEETSAKITLVNDLDNQKYAIYRDGIQGAAGDVTTPITGIYIQTKSDFYLQGRAANITLSEEAEAPKAAKVSFVGYEGADLLHYDAVLEGTELTAPETPSVPGMHFEKWVEGTDAAGAEVEKFVAGAEEKVYTAVYAEGSEVSTVNVKSNSFAKVTLQSGDAEALTAWTDATGAAAFADIPNGREYTYTIEKNGYAKKEGKFTLGIETYELTDKAEFDEDHGDYLYYEADWTEGQGFITNGANANAGERGINSTLGEGIVFPEDLTAVTIHVKVGMNRFGSRSNDVGHFTLKNADGAVVLGLRFSKTAGIEAFTGWNGTNVNMTDGYNETDVENKVEVVPSTGALTTPVEVDFTIDKTNNVITVISGETTMGILPLLEDPSNINTLFAGVYRENVQMSVYEVAAVKPDPMSINIAGDMDFAKVGGQTITKQYSKSEAVATDSGFTWKVEGPGTEGISIDNEGLLTVTDTTVPGVYKVTVTGNDTGKTASLDVTIGDFQQLTLIPEGPMAYDKTDAQGTYQLLSAVDTFGDNITELVTPAWSIDNTDVAEIDAATGALKVKAYGKATVKLTITNGTAVSEAEIPVTVGKYSIVKDVAGDTTTIDFAEIEKADNYLVTTSKDGAVVNQFTTTGEITTVKAAEAGKKITATYDEGALVSAEIADLAEGEAIPEATETTKVMAWKSLESMEPIKTATEVKTTLDVDTKDADKVEVGVIYNAAVTGNGTTGYAVGDTVAVPAGTYKFVITNDNSTDRGDVYVNEQMLVNNMFQYGKDPATYTANDIVVKEGYATIKTYDDKGIKVKVEITKVPSTVKRVPKMYVLGDSLVAMYYNGCSPTNNLNQTGWGQVLQNFITKDIEVVDLGNSGVTAPGLYDSAFTQVRESAQEGDYFILESGYNDKTYVSEPVMKEAVRNMVNEAREVGIKDIVLVSPNASQHDYSANVAWTTYMEDMVKELETGYVDLSQESYDFLNSRYGDKFGGSALNDYSTPYNVSDRLHSTYNAATCWASIIAQGLYNMGYKDIINFEYSYTFTDGAGEEITVQLHPTGLETE